MPDTLRIGIPSKGRLADVAGGLLSEAGLSFRRLDRSLFAQVRELPVQITFLRSDDIPVLCEEGAIDLGITGSDLVAESGANVVARLPLGAGHCRLAICVPESSRLERPDELAGKSIATSFPNLTRRYLQEHATEAHLVRLTGSVEVMIGLGVAEAIVDLVDSGSTLAANRLRVLDEIGQYETILIQNREARFAELADRVVRRLEGVVIAQSYSLLEYNVSAEQLAAAEAITPGYRSPTISRLEEEDWFSVRAMVNRTAVIEIMEQLEAVGATAILETRISNCRL